MVTGGNGADPTARIRIYTTICFVCLSIVVLFPLIHPENRGGAEMALRIVGGALLLVAAFLPLPVGKDGK